LREEDIFIQLFSALKLFLLFFAKC